MGGGKRKQEGTHGPLGGQKKKKEYPEGVKRPNEKSRQKVKKEGKGGKRCHQGRGVKKKSKGYQGVIKGWTPKSHKGNVEGEGRGGERFENKRHKKKWGRGKERGR